ncbi:hypothetical protein J2W91_004812 [Paenibacillus amylolyticus]|uniref:Uncharacterized protein n=1 Tax=Paenibacillus amylolyticus TaxID=1451 RepID=A0AAP5H9B4_PAEAM|nr:hypothetical protein [Paenibacillus amylolyticus]
MLDILSVELMFVHITILVKHGLNKDADELINSKQIEVALKIYEN